MLPWVEAALCTLGDESQNTALWALDQVMLLVGQWVSTGLILSLQGTFGNI